jgi:hypothetical protein
MLYVDQLHAIARTRRDDLLREAETDRLIARLRPAPRSRLSIRAIVARRLQELAYRVEPAAPSVERGIRPLAQLDRRSVT